MIHLKKKKREKKKKRLVLRQRYPGFNSGLDIDIINTKSTDRVSLIYK